jgi:DNA-binding transcriptional regulator YdaS (Cro superfamily)
MAKKNPVRQAVHIVGGPTLAANICGVSSATVHNWINACRVKDLVHALKLAEAAKMDVKELAGE